MENSLGLGQSMVQAESTETLCCVRAEVGGEMNRQGGSANDCTFTTLTHLFNLTAVTLADEDTNSTAMMPIEPLAIFFSLLGLTTDMCQV